MAVAQATHLYAIAIGSNRPHGHFGRPPQVIEAAIARLDRDFTLFDASPIVLNPAQGGAGRDFANCVALVESALEPPQLLEALKGLERAFGRRPSKRWAARVLDLDIAAWSGGRWQQHGLTVPHPRLAQRSFVIGPLAAIAPGWRLNDAGTARQLAARLARRRPRR
jgi:2-amino-4-hydroxy-6-hydroxymethyldihydropteridine diphosphokinase